MSKILLTGGTGQVGGALLHTLAGLGDIYAPNRNQLDLANPDSIRGVIRSFQPDWIVNPAAYTAVDKAESEPEAARAINVTAPAVLGEEAARLGAAVIHFSTDYVFDGTRSSPYVETDPTAPLNVYGYTKLAGEQALAASGAPYAIFRTSWVYGATGKNFLLTILRLARERETLRIVGDQHGAPTWSYDLALLTTHTISRAGVPHGLTELSGTYHASSTGETTWAGFAAEALARLREAEPDAKLAKVESITTAEYPTPAKRPHNSRLNCSKLAVKLGFTMPKWRDSLTKVMAQLSR